MSFRKIFLAVNPDIGSPVLPSSPASPLYSRTNAPSVYCAETVVFCISLVSSSGEPVPYSQYDSFELAIDNNFDHADSLMARAWGTADPDTSDSSSDSSDPQSINLPGDWDSVSPENGRLSVRISMNTVSYRAKIGTSEQIDAKLELKRYEQGAAVPTVIAQGTVTARNVVALDEGEPEPDDPLYYTAAQTLALLEGKVGPEGPQGPEGPEGPQGPEGPAGQDGADGADGQLIGASVSVSALTDGEILITHDAVPVTVKTNEGNIYPIEKGSLTSDSSGWHIDPAPYLAYDGAGSFTGPWTVYFAGGLPEIMTIIASGTSITPLEHQVYKHTLAASDVISIDTAGLTSSQCLTFELWLDMPSTAVAFTLPTMEWVDGAAPDFSEGDTRYVIVVRWNGSKLLANLAYTEDLA